MNETELSSLIRKEEEEINALEMKKKELLNNIVRLKEDRLKVQLKNNTSLAICSSCGVNAAHFSCYYCKKPRCDDCIQDDEDDYDCGVWHDVMSCKDGYHEYDYGTLF